MSNEKNLQVKTLTVKTKKSIEIESKFNLTPELYNLLSAIYELKTRKMDFNKWALQLIKKLNNDYLIVNAELSADKTKNGYNLENLKLTGVNENNIQLFLTELSAGLTLTADFNKFNFYIKGLLYEFKFTNKTYYIKFTNLKGFIENISSKLNKDNLTVKNPLSGLTGVIKMYNENIDLKTLSIKIKPKK